MNEVTQRGATWFQDQQSLPGSFLGWTVVQWFWAVAFSLTAGFVTSEIIGEADGWAVFACALVFIIASHLCFFADRIVDFPGLISLTAAIELLLAPVLAQIFPSTDWAVAMAVPLATYLQYAVPATAALWIGLHWPLNRSIDKADGREPSPLRASMRTQLDIVLVLGVLLATFAGSFPSGLFFLITIISSFRFFAALVWMITGTKGWKWRVGIVLIHLFALTSADGIFYTLVQWGGFFLLVYAFRRRWRGRLAVALVLALTSAVLLQYVKSDYRRYLYSANPGFADRVAALSNMMWGEVGQPSPQDSMTFSDVLVRFNEGWIVSRIMKRVPEVVPYARGETVENAVKFAILPRALVPDKPEAASRVLFLHYAGMRLESGTRMGLSTIGEMYANFGYWGGILGTFVFGFLLGLGYKTFVSLTRRSQNWWAIAPIVLLAAIEPAWNLEDTTNYIVKSALVLVLLVYTVPLFREVLSLEPLWGHRRISSVAMPRKSGRLDVRRTQ